MRPVIKRKRIDPRYFLHETVQVEETMANKDYDGDGEVESSEEEWRGSKDKAVKKALGKKEHEKTSDKDGDGVPDNKEGPGIKLLKGEKSLYEKIHSAIEEVFNEYLEENE